MSRPIISNIADFMRSEAPHYRDWPEGRLIEWIGWYWRDARVGVVCASGAIVGVALVRAMHDAARASDTYHHVEDGGIVWTDALICTHRAALGVLLSQARERFGERKNFGGYLMKHGGRPVLLPWTRMLTLKCHDYQHPCTA